jgi:hypothetical protein
MENKTEMIMYQTEDGQTKIDVRMENETVWLTQVEMAELFQKERTVITKHISNIFKEGELDEESNVQNLHFPNLDKPVKCYSLDVIISVADTLLEYGTRVQFSVFECHLEPEEMIKLTNRIKDQIYSTTDSVRFYILYGHCD